MSPGGWTVIIYKADESFRILDLLLVTELTMDPPTVPAAGSRKGPTSAKEKA